MYKAWKDLLNLCDICSSLCQNIARYGVSEFECKLIRFVAKTLHLSFGIGCVCNNEFSSIPLEKLDAFLPYIPVIKQPISAVIWKMCVTDSGSISLSCSTAFVRIFEQDLHADTQPELFSEWQRHNCRSRARQLKLNRFLEQLWKHTLTPTNFYYI